MILYLAPCLKALLEYGTPKYVMIKHEVEEYVLAPVFTS